MGVSTYLSYVTAGTTFQVVLLGKNMYTLKPMRFEHSATLWYKMHYIRVELQKKGFCFTQKSASVQLEVKYVLLLSPCQNYSSSMSSSSSWLIVKIVPVQQKSVRLL